MLSLIGAATSEPPMPSPFLTLIATCRPVRLYAHSHKHLELGDGVARQVG